MFRRLTLVLVVALLFPVEVAQAQWSMFSDEEQLRGKVVVDVGSLSAESSIASGGYEYDDLLDMEVWEPGETVEWLEFRGARTYCFNEGYALHGYSEAAVLLMDKDERLYLATFEPSIGSVKVDVELTFLVACPG